VPAALAPLIGSIEGLNNTFAIKPMLHDNGQFGPPLSTSGQSGTVTPDFKTSLGFGFSPSDFRTYYKEASLIAGGIGGTKTPDCIGLAAVSDVLPTTFGAFTSRFALPAEI
jgi:hypothetical protein